MSSRGDCWTCSSFEKMRKHVIAIASLHASPTPSHPSGKPTAVPSSVGGEKMIITASPERQDMSGLFGGSCTRLVMGSDFAIYQQLSHGQLPRSWRSWTPIPVF